jgi:preprotein translocase subunit SecG
VLAALFFLLSLGMGIYLKINGAPQRSNDSDLGVMAGLGKQPAKSQNAQPSTPAAPAKTETPVPSATGGDVPTAPATKTQPDVPAAPAKH